MSPRNDADTALHRTAVISATDPGAIGQGRSWCDTSGEAPVLYIRNDDDTGWLPVSGPAGPAGADGANGTNGTNGTSAPVPTVVNLTNADNPYTMPGTVGSYWVRCDTSAGDITVNTQVGAHVDGDRLLITCDGGTNRVRAPFGMVVTLWQSAAFVFDGRIGDWVPESVSGVQQPRGWVPGVAPTAPDPTHDVDGAPTNYGLALGMTQLQRLDDLSLTYAGTAAETVTAAITLTYNNGSALIITNTKAVDGTNVIDLGNWNPVSDAVWIVSVSVKCQSTIDSSAATVTLAGHGYQS